MPEKDLIKLEPRRVVSAAQAPEAPAERIPGNFARRAGSDGDGLWRTEVLLEPVKYSQATGGWRLENPSGGEPDRGQPSDPTCHSSKTKLVVN